MSGAERTGFRALETAALVAASEYRAMRVQQSTEQRLAGNLLDALIGDAETPDPHMLDRLAPLRRAQKLSCARLRQPDAASRRIALSSSASARRRLSLAFSFSRSFSRFA